MLTIINHYLASFRNDEKGATAIEYGLLAALIALAIIIAVGGVGDALNGVFEYASGEFSDLPG